MNVLLINASRHHSSGERWQKKKDRKLSPNPWTTWTFSHVWATESATLICPPSPLMCRSKWPLSRCHFSPELWCPAAYKLTVTSSQTLTAQIMPYLPQLLCSCFWPKLYHCYKVLYSLICSCLSMWSSHARRTAMTLCLLSSSSISPSTCGWGSSSHLRHAKSTLRPSTMPA